jgi:hypothetical protein
MDLVGKWMAKQQFFQENSTVQGTKPLVIQKSLGGGVVSLPRNVKGTKITNTWHLYNSLYVYKYFTPYNSETIFKYV